MFVNIIEVLSGTNLYYHCIYSLINYRASVNLSGRTLKRIPFLTHVNFVKSENCSLEEYLDAMFRAVAVEKNEKEDIEIKYLKK